jgi:hypothetical protein
MARRRGLAGGEVALLARRVCKAVDRGADAAEQIHKKAAHLPLDVLDRTLGLEDVARGARRVQDRAIHAVYELVRDVNHQVTRLADELVGTRGRRRAVRPRSAPARAAKQAATA